MNAKTSVSRVFGLDLLRAFAILCVVLAHYFASTPLAIGGFLGVELFFVLSGFLIGGILMKFIALPDLNWSDLKNFWIRRWARTVPNYVAFLLVFTLIPSFRKDLSFMDWLLYPLFFQNVLWPINGFFGVSWSLAIEEWFYLLFPLVAFLLIKALKGPSGFVFSILFFLITSIALRSINAYDWNIYQIRGIVGVRLDSIVYGVLAAYLKNVNRVSWSSRLTAVGGAACGLALVIIGTIWFYSESRMAHIFAFPMVSVGFAFCLPLFENIRRWPGYLGRAVSYSSKVSYSVYLIHMPFFILIDACLAPYYSNSLIKLFFRLCLILAVFAVSWIPYYWIEARFIKLRDFFPDPRQDGSHILR